MLDKKESILSNWITVSDEAFAMLVGENNIDRWMATRLVVGKSSVLSWLHLQAKLLGLRLRMRKFIAYV